MSLNLSASLKHRPSPLHGDAAAGGTIPAVFRLMQPAASDRGGSFYARVTPLIIARTSPFKICQ